MLCFCCYRSTIATNKVTLSPSSYALKRRIFCNRISVQICSCRHPITTWMKFSSYSADINLLTSHHSADIFIDLLTMSTTLPCLNLDLITQRLVDKLCAAKFDITEITKLIKLTCESLESMDRARICISTKHKLCKSLTTAYFLLLEHETDNFPELLSYIHLSLTCMNLLKQSTVASHILCRSLLERSLVYGNLFNEKFDADLIGNGQENTNWNREESLSMTRENLKVSLGHRFRCLPNYTVRPKKKIESKVADPSKPRKEYINCYLLIEAFKSSINNMEAFADLFVEFHCPVMFDKLLWPNDDALRVINERNLSILRRFEQIPPFWDLYELIGQSSCLKNCLVLVKALLAAHLALWGSASANSSHDKMISTSRLIPPLAQSGLIPGAFGLTVDVLPHLKPNEIFSVLSDIWHYLKDTNSTDVQVRPKAYLNRLRVFMCQHTPGDMYVKLYKELQRLEA